jgi:hypothetical protein
MVNKNTCNARGIIDLLIYACLYFRVVTYPDRKSLPTYDYKRAKADLMQYNPDPLAPKL